MNGHTGPKPWNFLGPLVSFMDSLWMDYIKCCKQTGCLHEASSNSNQPEFFNFGTYSHSFKSSQTLITDLGKDIYCIMNKTLELT